MRKLKFWKGKQVQIVLAVVVMAISGSVVAQPMSGTYTVCASGCDYSTPAAAASALAGRGVSGAVVIDIQPGIYTTQLSITAAITGASASRTITFQGQGRNTMIRSASFRELVELSNVRWLTIRNIMIENSNPASGNITIYMVNCRDTKILNCDLKASYGSNNNYCIYGSSCEYLEIRNNKIHGGNFNVYLISTPAVGYNKFYNNRITQSYSYAFQHEGYQNDEIIENYIDSSRHNQGGGYMLFFNNVRRGGIRLERNIVPGYNATMCLYWSQGAFGPNQDSYLINNMFGSTDSNSTRNTNYTALISCANSSLVNIRLNIWHNTFALAKSHSATTGALYFYNPNSIGASVKNNNFWLKGKGVALSVTQLNSGNDFEDNNYWNAKDSTRIVALLKNNSIYNFQNWKAYCDSTGGHERYSLNMPTTFVSAYDLHYDQTVPAPHSRGLLNVLIDVDGNNRCRVFPSAGADENSVGKGRLPVVFTAPSTVYRGYPTVFLNAAKNSEPRSYKWFIDGVYQTDSIHLETKMLTGSSHQVMLIATSCAGADSMVKTITTIQATSAPVSNFTASALKIEQGQTVLLRDNSSNAPTNWSWKISPENTRAGNQFIPNFRVTYGWYDQHRIQVRFTEPGLYKVCLTTGNNIGSGNEKCIVDYIEVVPAVKMGSVATVSYPAGKLYDYGGAYDSYSTSAQPKRITIDACADTVYFKFKNFDMHCAYDYLQAFEGKDKTGKALHDCITNNPNGFGPGWTGLGAFDSCGGLCKPDFNKVYKAVGAVTFEQSTVYGTGAAGYEIEWWTSPKTVAKPVAEFEVADTVCTNEFVNFVNTSKGDDNKYYWDLDGDVSFFESTSSTTATWPYFYPQQYTITLIAQNCGGVDTFQKTIVVLDPPPPRAQFVADNINPAAGDVVFFTSTIKECVDDYIWKFTKVHGSGTAVYANGTTFESRNPEVSFADTGLWTVEMEAINITGKDKIVQKGYINVKGAYCVPDVATLQTDIGISRVKFHTLNNASAQATVAYSNYAKDKALTVSVEHGIKYEYSIERSTNANNASRAILIDWNGDGDFTDQGENVATENAGKALTWTDSIIIPSTAKIGATTMRIAINHGSFTNKPCGLNEYGEYEDYRLYITEDKTPPVITLFGKDTVTFELGNKYVEPGYGAIDMIDGDVTSKVVLTSSPTYNEAVPNTYVFSYNVSDSAGNKAMTKKRVVRITPDVTAPDLQVSKPDTIIVEVFTPFTAFTILKADDQVSGDLKANVVATPNPQTIKTAIVDTIEIVYSVADLAGNTTMVKRWIIVRDTTRPTMQLRGLDTVEIPLGSAYQDSGVEVADNYYTEAYLRANGLKVTSTVNENLAGTYEVRYELTDGSGNKATPSLVRSVVVIDTTTLLGEEQDWSKAVTIYPNPNNGRFNVNVDLPTGERVRMVVLDAMGRQVRTVEEGRNSSGNNQNNYEVDMSGTSAGVYLLQVTGANYSFVKRVVVTM